MTDRKKRHSAKAADNGHLTRLYNEGNSIAVLAKAFYVSESSMSKWLNGTVPCPGWTLPVAEVLQRRRRGANSERIFVLRLTPPQEKVLKTVAEGLGIQMTEVK